MEADKKLSMSSTDLIIQIQYEELWLCGFTQKKETMYIGSYLEQTSLFSNITCFADEEVHYNEKHCFERQKKFKLFNCCLTHDSVTDIGLFRNTKTINRQ